ncbi:MAG: ATP-binding cassette domain-containing protein [Candidatus Odinarchaeota archaeon]|nr:ATP-binding cassette domain-containing protein [Candidatus Odinarchaeota archaeon]
MGIQIKNLKYKYPRGTHDALNGINLEIKEGEFVAIMGPNGAGKTTLLLTLNGIIPHSVGGSMRGRVYIDDMSTAKHRIYELASKVGMVLQNPESQIFMPNVESELAFGPENLGVPPEEIGRRIKWALKLTRLEGMEERSPLQLSGGQKQVVAVAAALTMMPKYMVLDEPTSQLDPYGTNMVFETIKKLNKEQGITVIMASHKSELISEYADRVILLDKGQVVFDGPPEEAFMQQDLLRRIKVKIPHVSDIAFRLKNELKVMGENEKPFLTTKEAITWLKQAMDSGKINLNPSKLDTSNDKEIDTSNNIAIDVQNVKFTYPTGVEALKGINLSIREGEFIAIVGQNGAGKSTLVKNITGVLRPTEGKILLHGKDIINYSVAEIAKTIGMVLQNPDHQLFSNRVYDEIAFGPKNLGWDDETIDKQIKETIKLVELPDEYLEYHPLSLSWGDRQKVAIAAILSMDPSIIILDEPTTGQDFAGRYMILEIAKKMNEELNKTVIMITHDIDLVAAYASRTVVMGKGKILLDDVTRKVFSQPDVLEKTYLSPPQITSVALELLKANSNVPLSVDEFMNMISV